jgi:hypothetical protein
MEICGEMLERKHFFDKPQGRERGKHGILEKYQKYFQTVRNDLTTEHYAKLTSILAHSVPLIQLLFVGYDCKRYAVEFGLTPACNIVYYRSIKGRFNCTKSQHNHQWYTLQMLGL